jgi:MoaA/NifB/PqqE/SkfB family radical SAM enzyme
VDITGGAPELNPHLRQLVQAVRQDGREVQVRTNLTVLLEKGQEDTIDFLRRHGVRLIASMPCYLDENVTTQRGPGVYCRSVEAIRRLNEAGDLPPISVPT